MKAVAQWLRSPTGLNVLAVLYVLVLFALIGAVAFAFATELIERGWK